MVYAYYDDSLRLVLVEVWNPFVEAPCMNCSAQSIHSFAWGFHVNDFMPAGDARGAGRSSFTACPDFALWALSLVVMLALRLPIVRKRLCVSVLLVVLVVRRFYFCLSFWMVLFCLFVVLLFYDLLVLLLPLAVLLFSGFVYFWYPLGWLFFKFCTVLLAWFIYVGFVVY